MKEKNKIKIVIGILAVLIIFWQSGLFYRYNYITSKIDIILNQPKLVEIGVMSHFGIANNGLNQKFGFIQDNVGCFISETQIRGIKAYNKEIEKYLVLRNGTEWREEYQIGIDSIVRLRNTEKE